MVFDILYHIIGQDISDKESATARFTSGVVLRLERPSPRDVADGNEVIYHDTLTIRIASIRCVWGVRMLLGQLSLCN